MLSSKKNKALFILPVAMLGKTGIDLIAFHFSANLIANYGFVVYCLYKPPRK